MEIDKKIFIFILICVLIFIIGFVIYKYNSKKISPTTQTPTTQTPTTQPPTTQTPTTQTPATQTPTTQTPTTQTPTEITGPSITFYSEEDYGGTYKTLPFVTNIKYSLNSSTCGPDEYKITFLPNSIKLKNVNDTILIRLHGDYSKTEDYCSSSHRMIFAKDKMSKLFTNFSTDETFDYKDRDNAAMKGYITFIQ